MSIAQEMKDFAAMFTTVSNAVNEHDKAKAYAAAIAAKLPTDDPNNPDYAASHVAPEPGQLGYHDPAAPPAAGATARPHKAIETATLPPVPPPPIAAAAVAGSPTPYVPPPPPAPAPAPSPQPDDTFGVTLHSGGGTVKRYDMGGAVSPDDQDQQTKAPVQALPLAPPPPATAPPTPTPLAPSQAIQTAAPTPLPAAAPQPAQGQSLGLPAILHNTVMFLQKEFGLDQPDPAVGGANPHKQAGQAALMRGVGAADTATYNAAINAVDPDKKLTDAAAQIRTLNTMYNLYLARGEPEAADRAAASLVQYTINRAAEFGAGALVRLQKGDIAGGAALLQKAYNSIPDGKGAENLKVAPNGAVSITQTDALTGKALAQHSLSPQDLLAAAVGLKNKSLSWQALLAAAGAGSPAGVTSGAIPRTDAAERNLNLLSGANADGSPTTPDGGAPNMPAGTTLAEVTPAGNSAPRPPRVMPDSVSPIVKSTMAAMPPVTRAYVTQLIGGENNAWDPTIINDSGHAGLGQFSVKGWKQATGYTIPANIIGTKQDPRLDAGKSIQAVLDLANQNIVTAQKALGRPPSAAELAVMHQQGTAGGLALIQAPPDMKASDVLSKFYKKGMIAKVLGGNGIRPSATAAEAVATISNHYRLGGGTASTGGATPAGSVASTQQPAQQPGERLAGIPIESPLSSDPERPTEPTAPTQILPTDIPAMPTRIQLDANATPENRRSAQTLYNGQMATWSKIYKERKDAAAEANSAANVTFQHDQTVYADRVKQWRDAGGEGPKPLGTGDLNAINTRLFALDGTDRDPSNQSNTPPIMFSVQGLTPGKQPTPEEQAQAWQLWGPATGPQRLGLHNTALNIATSNGLTPDKALDFALNLLETTPGKVVKNKMRDGPLPFEVHAMPGTDKYLRIVMRRDGESFILPKAQFGEAMAVRGDHHLAVRTAVEAGATSATHIANRSATLGQLASTTGKALGDAASRELARSTPGNPAQPLFDAAMVPGAVQGAIPGLVWDAAKKIWKTTSAIPMPESASGYSTGVQ